MTKDGETGNMQCDHVVSMYLKHGLQGIVKVDVLMVFLFNLIVLRLKRVSLILILLILL